MIASSLRTIPITFARRSTTAAQADEIWRNHDESYPPFLLFDGNCAEAMTFYKACPDGELELTRVSDTPMKAHVPPAIHHRIIHAHLNSGTEEFSATDSLHQTRKPQPGNSVAMYLTGGSHADLRRIFDRLSERAPRELRGDLTVLPFGTFGHLADKYGVHIGASAGSTGKRFDGPGFPSTANSM